jgi:hypothetical protein
LKTFSPTFFFYKFRPDEIISRWRMRLLFLFCLVLAIIIFCNKPVFGGFNSSVISEAFLQDRWTTEQGLPQNTVISIVQTRDGYIWLGTFGGLVRFDGVKFTVFNTINAPEPANYGALRRQIGNTLDRQSSRRYYALPRRAILFI